MKIGEVDQITPGDSLKEENGFGVLDHLTVDLLLKIETLNLSQGVRAGDS